MVDDVPHPNPDERRARFPVPTKETIGTWLGIVLAVLVFLAMPKTVHPSVAGAGPPVAEHALAVTAATAALMATWWVTEAIPLAMTALLPLVIFPLSRVNSFGATASHFASGTIFLFMGGFFLALAIQRWDLHRRIALHIVVRVGTKPRQLVLGLMSATGVMTMWVTNSATAVMMLPIAISVMSLVHREADGAAEDSNLGKSMVLGVAYAASIVSVSTIISTPPNTLLRAYVADTFGITLSFGQWMLFGVPLGWGFLFIGWWLLTHVIFPPEIEEIPGGREVIEKELRAMGPMGRGERRVAVVFVAAALSWVLLPSLFPGVMSDELVAVLIALVLFLMPAGEGKRVRLLDWDTAKGIPWDILLLFGGGLSLSAAFTSTGFSAWIGDRSTGLAGLPPVLMVFLVAILINVLTELTSNTATAAAFLPVMGSVAVGMGVAPMMLLLPVALASTSCFMMPAATPPNAVAYASGYVRISDMVRAGIVLSMVSALLITVFTVTLGPVVFGFSLG